MVLLLIDLDNKQVDKLKFDIGDILVFDGKYPYTYYLVIYDAINYEYKLLSLVTNKSYTGYKQLDELINAATDIEENEGDRLIEVLHKNEVVLRRVDDGR